MHRRERAGAPDAVSGARWSRLRDEVLACLALAGDARAQRLRELALEDADLAAEVKELLAEEERAELIRPGAALEARPDTRLVAGRRVGAWRLRRRLGRGGMGEVWEAERVAGDFDQRAAIKFVSGPILGRDLVERFRRERGVLARLEQAHIARLLDGGESEHGEPYLVMELVEGVPIDEWCNLRGLGLDERVRLLTEVCDAVHFAHQRLVVHRDLKPANILVGESGGTKLLDFGVAKLLEAVPDPELTSRGYFTPRYASPEQVLGEEVTTASDVYALSVVLFELCTGADPYGVPATSALQYAQAVARDEPRRASQCIDPLAPVAAREGGARRLARRLAGDLERILAVGLAKDPARRYATASALADDLRRYLDGRPVAARDDGWTYRASRLVRRHRLASALAVGLALSLVAGMALSWRTTSRALRAEERAQRRFDQVRELARTLVFGVHDRVGALGGSSELRRYLIETTRDYLDDLAAEGELSPELAAELAETYLRLAEVQGGQTRGGAGDVAGALASIAAALDLWGSLDADGQDVSARLAAAHGLAGDLERIAGRDAQAREHYARLEELSRARLALDPGDLEARHDVFRALTQRARLSYLAGARQAALALELDARELLAPAAARPEVARDLALCGLRIGEELVALGEPRRALDELTLALESARAGRARAPSDLQLALDEGNLLRELARAHAALLEWPAAFERIESAIAILRPAQAADPRNFVLGEALSIALESLAGWRRSLGEREQALALYRESLELMQALHEAGPDNRHARDGVMRLTTLVGLVLRDLGDEWAAAECFERVQTLLEATPWAASDEGAVELGVAVRTALLEIGSADDEEALGAGLEALWNEVEDLRRRFPDVAWPERRRGQIATSLGEWLERRAALGSRPAEARRADLERARELHQTSLDIAHRLEERHWLLASELDVAQRCADDLRRCEEALRRLEAAAGP
jgi:non-specific serine/threonine protein kinase/serine/threonine-protein kinase